jgi:hypothetical protein
MEVYECNHLLSTVIGGRGTVPPFRSDWSGVSVSPIAAFLDPARKVQHWRSGSRMTQPASRVMPVHWGGNLCKTSLKEIFIDIRTSF